MDNFELDCKTRGLSPASILGYRTSVSHFANWLLDTLQLDIGTQISEFPVSDVTQAEVMRYRQALLRQGKRGTSVNTRMAGLKRFFRYLEQTGVLRENPITGVKNPMTGVRYVKRQKLCCPAGLTDGEVHALLRAAGLSRRSPKRNYALVQLLVQTGLCVSEVCALTVGDVTLNERSGSVRVVCGKGGRGREIPLTAAARRGLRLYLNLRQTVSGRPLEPEEPLLLSKRRERMTPRAVQSLIERLAQRAKITRIKVTPQVFRHTFALNFLKDHPGSIEMLAALLGHELLETTAIYTLPSHDLLVEHMEQMGAGLENRLRLLNGDSPEESEKNMTPAAPVWVPTFPNLRGRNRFTSRRFRKNDSTH